MSWMKQSEGNMEFDISYKGATLNLRGIWSESSPCFADLRSVPPDPAHREPSSALGQQMQLLFENKLEL
ncbi:hypothetical protein AVEN_95661-1 [Araneus ventricosus]|uniref:Uncharacterized protein n=1 Tax=Araneus ventricosus TaxID=182803 RepID=A0A4Y2WP37_ARAVE|nr:hypothetical protein AVEN_95661-1 [Araneus ventricosus]